MDDQTGPKKRKPGGGRKRVYSGAGAPLLRVRLEPDVHERVTGRPEGARKYIERIVRDDVVREEEGGA